MMIILMGSEAIVAKNNARGGPNAMSVLPVHSIHVMTSFVSLTRTLKSKTAEPDFPVKNHKFIPGTKRVKTTVL